MNLYWSCLLIVFVGITCSKVRAQTVEVTAVTYDANSQTLSLTFSAEVSLSDLACEDYNGFVLQDAVVVTPAHSAVLDSGNIVECTAATDPGNLVNFRFVYYELFSMVGLFESADNAALAWDANLFLATSSFTITAGAIAVTTFIADTTRPNLASFAIDLDTGVLILTFDTAVDTSTANFNSFSLYDGTSNDILTVYGFTPSSQYTNVPVFNLDSDTLGSIAVSSVCRSPDTCYALVSPGFIDDPSGNSVVPIEINHALLVEVITEDMTQPELYEFQFNQNDGYFTLMFSEAVDVSSLTVSAITFSNGASSTTSTGSVTLTDGMAYSSSSFNVIDVYLSTTDIANLDGAEVCQSGDACYISFNSNMVQDYNANQIIPVASDSALTVSSFTVLKIQVNVTAVSYDANERSLVLTFSDTVDIDAVNCEYNYAFILQNDVTNPTIVYPLYNYPITECSLSGDETQVTFQLSDFDNFTRYGLFVSADTAVLSWTIYIFEYSSSYFSPNGTLAVTYTPDTTSPRVIFFEMDLNTGTLTILFDSDIDPFSVDFNELSLFNGIDETITISGDTSTGFNSGLYILFDRDSIAAIAMSTTVCTSAANCYIYFSEEFISDPYGNNVVAIGRDSSWQVTTFTPDVTSPLLEQFSIQGYSNSLTLTFSEAVNPNTFDVTSLQLNDMEGGALTRELTGGVVTSPSYDTIHIVLSDDDMLALGDMGTCQTIQTCFLSFLSATIQDYNGNEASNVVDRRASYFEFSSGGVAVTSVTFDHYRQSVYLNFSRPVDLGSVSCDQRLLTYENNLNPPTTFTPSYSGQCWQNGPSAIGSRLDERDYVAMIKMDDFWLDSSHSYLTWSVYLLDNIANGKRQVDELSIDYDSPGLVSFYLNLEEGVLTINYDSIVDPNSINLTRIALQNEYSSNFFRSGSYQLTGGLVLSTDCGNTSCIQLTIQDLTYLRNSEICSTRHSCYINIDNGAISDPFGNQAYSYSSQVRRIDGYRDEGGLGVSLRYSGGCSRDIYLLPDEPLILQPVTGEKVVSIWCGGDQQLGWKSGGLENVTSPFNDESQSSIDFPNGLDPRHFGVFVCSSSSSDTIFTQNFINSTYYFYSSYFVGSPDGGEINVLFYAPLNYWIHFWPEGLVTEIVVYDHDRTVIPVDITISNYSAVISVDANDVVESFSGNYAIVVAGPDYRNVTHYVKIVVEAPVIEPSNTDVLIGRTQTVLTLTCSPNNQQLPIVWREGERSLTETTPGVSLAPPTLNHRLTLDLDTYSLSGEEDIVCEILHPDDQQIVVSSATIEISLPEEGVEQCEGERDEVWGIMWDTTNEGVTDEQDCSSDPDIVGIARRSCLKGGQWNNPDLSNCESAVFAGLRKEIEEDLESDDIATRNKAITVVLDTLECVFTPDEGTTLFPRDLINSNNILEEVVAKLIEDLGVDGHDFQTDAVGVFDKMLARTHVESWKSVTEFDQSDASLLLEITESYAEYVAMAILSDSTDTNDTVIILTEDNLEVWAEKLDTRDYSDVVYPEDGERDSDRAQIRIPAAHLSSRRATVVVNMKIENIEKFLPEDEKGVPVALVISSQVIASQDSSAASTPIQLKFTTFPMRYARNPRCVYWNFDQRVWLEDGITVLEVMALGNYSYKVTCESSHLTSFSVIVDIFEEDGDFEFTVDVYVGVGVLTGCALISSLLYSLSLITCCCGEYRSLNVLHLAHLGLSLSLLCVGVLFLAGLTLATENTAACTAAAGLLQYCFTSAFTWILIIVVLATVVVATAKPDSLSWKWTLVSILFGLVLPVIPTAFSVGLLVDDYGNQAFCWIGNEVDEKALWANVAPMAAISLTALLMVIVGLVFICIRGRQYTELSITGSLIIVMSAVVVMVLVGGSWGSGVVMVNGNWDPAHWLFLAFSSALGVVSLTESILLVCFSTKFCNIITVGDVKEKEDTQYWKDKKPLIRETSGLQTGYEMKTKGGDNAYAMMGTGPSDGEMVAMMGDEEQQRKPEKQEVIANEGAITTEVEVEETKLREEEIAPGTEDSTTPET